ncbi:MAG TPA: ATP-binding protein [Gemmatimonadaceae bacterium]|nr:ATP-binding protein [Gemmatimonadaceae bacterium]
MPTPSPRSDDSSGAGARYEWRIASDVREIDAIVATVTRACADAGYPPKACRLNVPVALTEAIANAIMRGNGGDATRQVQVCAVIDEEMLCVEVTDEGAGFDTEQARAMCDDPEWLEREDGRGVFLMFALMDKVETWCDAGHTVRLVLRRT